MTTLEEQCKELANAWNEFLKTIGREFGIYKLIDWIMRLIK